MTLGVADEDHWPVSFEVAGTEPNPAKAWEKQLRQAAKSLAGEAFLGVVLSVPGLVDEAANRILFSPNIHWTEQADLPAIAGRVWPVPVLLVQEERALALGHLTKSSVILSGVAHGLIVRHAVEEPVLSVVEGTCGCLFPAVILSASFQREEPQCPDPQPPTPFSPELPPLPFSRREQGASAP